MRRRRTIALAVTASVAAAIGGDRAGGFSWFQYGGVDVIWPGAQSVRYLSPTAFPAGSTEEQLLLGAMGLWNLVPASDFQYFYSNDGLDTIDNFDGYSDTIVATLDPGVLAATYMVNQGAAWFDMDMVFAPNPEGVGWLFATNPTCTEMADPQTHGYSLLMVAAHELGHALGLGHDPIGTEPSGTPWFVKTMNPRYPSGGPVGQNNIVELHADDRSGTRYLYPHSGPADPPVVDLASANFTSNPTVIGKAIPVYFSPTAVDPAGTVTARSVIENFGTTSEFGVSQGFYLSTNGVVDTADVFLGSLLWDIAFGDGFEFEVAIDMPADLPAGDYTLGAILDDLDQIAEAYEDNNAVAYCQPLTIRQLSPAIDTLPQETTSCGVPYSGPAPTVSHPLNMNPIAWSLDNPEPGMAIDPTTGVVSWPSPVRSEFLYTIFVRATNTAGTATQTLFLGVTQAAPQIDAVPDETVPCGVPYAGPIPVITSPVCMDPIINWSLDAGPAGMTIDFNTGVVSWPDPVPSVVPYLVTVRATNAGGNGTQSWLLTVTGGDMDADGDVDLNDFTAFHGCMSGPGVLSPAGCQCADTDTDGDVDLGDYARTLAWFDGAAPEGACCFGDGTCTDGTAFTCTVTAGTYLGDGTSCAVTGCLGACCFSNGACLDLDQMTCEGLPATVFQGFGTDCATTVCP